MQNDFENINAQGGTPPSVSFEKAWASLQPTLDLEADRRKKKRRRIVFFWLSIIAIGLVSGLVFKNGNTGGNGIVGKTNLPKGFSTPASSSINVAPAIVSVGLMKYKQTNKVTKTSKEGKEKLRNNSITKTPNEVIAKNNYGKKEGIQGKEILLSNKIEVAIKKERALIENASNTLEAKSREISKIDGDSASIVAIQKTVDTLKKVDSTVDKKSLAKNSEKKPKTQLLKGIHFGFQFNAPVHAGVNTLDVNTKKQPLSMFVPQVFVSKQLSKRSSLWISATPYAQFYLNNSVVLSAGTYNVTIQQGSTQDSKPKQYVYRETVGINKLISVEATLGYQYQLSNKLKLGVGIANNWLQAALINTKITMNNTTVTHDSLYGNDNSGKEWKHLKPTFLLGKFDVGYQYKSVEFGAVVSTPISNLTSKELQYKTPINTNVFVRWYLK